MIASRLIGLLVVLFATKTLTAIDIVDFAELKQTTAELVRSRGYIAEEYKVATSDGYILTLVRALNPLINQGKEGLDSKDVLLCIPGSVTTAKLFVVNSKGAKPKDHGHLNASLMSDEELNDLLGDDPASKSFALTALNFGHEVWLFNRRGSLESLGHTKSSDRSLGLLQNLYYDFFDDLPSLSSDRSNNMSEFIQSINEYQQSSRNINFARLEAINKPKYWNFSLDEQALIDLPEVIDYVLEETGREKLAIVGHSAGGALALMMLSDKPEMAEKISKSILWAPALYLGSSNEGNKITKILTKFVGPIVGDYLGPMPPYSLIKQIEFFAIPLCSCKLASRTVCNSILDSLNGPSGNQQAVTPVLLSSMPTPVGSGEARSLLQSTEKGKMHHLDYMEANRNMIAYGQAQPPIYDVSKITSETMHFYVGVSDKLVITKDVEQIIADLSVPAQFTLLDDSGYFNHMSFIIHDQVGKQLNFPCLKVLESE